MNPNPKTEALSIRAYDSERDYKTIQKWWIQRDGVFVRKEWLSTIGVVIEQNGEPICMTWLYLSNSRMAQVGWTTTKPGLGPITSYKAVSMALSKVQSIAEKNGVTYIHSMSNKTGLTKIMKRLGFQKFDGYDYLAFGGGNGN